MLASIACYQNAQITNNNPTPHSLLPIPYFLFLLCVVFNFTSCASLSPVDGKTERLTPVAALNMVRVQWQPFAPERADGLEYFAGRVSKPRIEFHALRIDLNAPGLRIMAAGGGVAAGELVSIKVSSFVRDNDLLAGINALPFEPVSGTEGEPRTNVGVVIADGVMVSAPHAGFDALVFYDDGSAAIVAQSRIDSVGNIVNAVGGFHRILEEYELTSRALNSDARHTRSAAGISICGRYVYLLVIDGRRPGGIGATEAETAFLLRALGASEGINLDGGGSTALALRYPDGNIRVVNTPIHGQIPGRERAVAGCLGLRLAE